MLPNISTLGIRFDIDKLESGAYAIAAWKVFWRAVDIDSLAGATVLWEGDTAATLNGSEKVFCIVVQSVTADLEAVQSTLEQNTEFQSVTASPPFVEAADAQKERLPEAGQIDPLGNLVGKAYNARPALGAVQKERQEGRQSDQLSTAVPERKKPASRRTEQPPNISSLVELLDFLLTRFGLEKYFFWLTPEELCDIVERYANILQVQWHEASCALSVDMTYVTLFNKGKAGNNIALHGIFPFGNETDAVDFCYDNSSNPKELFGQLEKLWGIHGKFATNFFGQSHSNWVDEDRYDKQRDIDAFDLWPRICRKRLTLGISSPITKDSVSEEEEEAEETVQVSQKVAKKWWQFWKKEKDNMVLIPAGELSMGNHHDVGDDEEKPKHTVYLDAFYMDVYEVTNAQYRKFMDATGHNSQYYWNDSLFNAPDQPVVGVNWEDARATANGLASACRQRQSGRRRRAEDWLGSCIHGEMIFPVTMTNTMAVSAVASIEEPALWVTSRRIAMDCTIWLVWSGSGVGTGTIRNTIRGHPSEIRQDLILGRSACSAAAI